MSRQEISAAELRQSGSPDGFGHPSAPRQQVALTRINLVQVRTIDPKAGRIDDVSDTDGTGVTNCPGSSEFTAEFLSRRTARRNARGNQNFSSTWRTSRERR
jgi:hypothetical protein